MKESSSSRSEWWRYQKKMRPNIFISEINRRKIKLKKEKLFMDFNRGLCNNALYSDPKYKESAIILSHIINDLMVDFLKEVYDCVNVEGAYKNE